ncbi:MAG: hypothetical protein UW30_C0001G0030 [Candidatus Giovannonibacteria bacterium GW2011_GWA2_44_13b]|uniref:Methyltransferase type 11 domain-containing protein n=2 Tax=Candidatus Giovannoniibacteriota TaxID=1752738 RepID=A0A0G1H694_9BACT|nr:MAG: hypothetical protein UW30_C0001G0030 [Candidatus Giovannonibacteria bacterium GW2011_GWA2_44_13b]OGF83215.1 MAG: hypothetical protein A2924_02775 [Candidatus Giovannonibacteria bacterium RIFCSPLOWO2_01_FULL_44_16]
MPEQSPITEKSKELMFREYMENLKLSPEDFEKTILDVGSAEGEFAMWAKEHGLSDKIYSLDSAAYQENADNMVRSRAEALPFKDESFDMTISDCSMPIMLYEAENSEKSIKEMVSEIIRVTKKNGEIRMAPVPEWRKVDTSWDSSALKLVNDTFEQEIGTLIKQKRISLDKISLGTSPTDTGNRVENFLYILKKLG